MDCFLSQYFIIKVQIIRIDISIVSFKAISISFDITVTGINLFVNIIIIHLDIINHINLVELIFTLGSFDSFKGHDTNFSS